MPSSSFKKENALYCIEKRDNWREAIFRLRDIAEQIRASDIYENSDLKVIIEEDKIYLGHSLQEIDAFFPWLPKIITDRNFNEYNLTIFAAPSDSVIVTNVTDPIDDQQAKFSKNAKSYFAKSTFEKNPKIIDSALAFAKDPNQVLLSLAENNQGVIIGENHSDRSSKKLLIDNMAKLKEQGVTTIFMEHLLDDTQKEMLENYFQSEDSIMPPLLQDFLQRLDKSLMNDKEFHPYSYTGLIMSAKQNGMKVIPIDTRITASTEVVSEIEGKSRCLMMNYEAAIKISEHQKKFPDDKYVVFCGSEHIGSIYQDVPGIAEISGSPSVIVADVNQLDSIEKIQVDYKQKRDIADFFIRMKPTQSKESLVLKDQYDKTMLAHFQAKQIQHLRIKEIASQQKTIPDRELWLKELVGRLYVGYCALKGNSKKKHAGDFTRISLSKDKINAENKVANYVAVLRQFYQQEQEKYCKGMFGKRRSLKILSIISINILRIIISRD